MAFSAKDVMTLREATGLGMMDCKKALTEADGDFEKAKEILREKGILKADKKLTSRVAAEGVVAAYIDGKVGALFEVNCESDFVARGPKFQEIVSKVGALIVVKNPADVDALMALELDGTTVELFLKEQISVIGEKIAVRRFVRYETDGTLESYIHMGGKAGVLVEVDSASEAPELKELAHDICLQICAAKPSYVSSKEVPAEVLEKEKEILMQQAINEGKPANIAEKMVNGRIRKYYQDNCLLDQAFVKDGDKTIAQVIKEAAPAVGSVVTVRRFAHFVMGEGIEKKSEDLSAEVEKQIEAMKK
ncbi:MAG: elongation factor Ts [Clostridia bacterium]|nr:elongation factor Ts [Clostridia bacterium]